MLESYPFYVLILMNGKKWFVHRRCAFRPVETIVSIEYRSNLWTTFPSASQEGVDSGVMNNKGSISRRLRILLGLLLFLNILAIGLGCSKKMESSKTVFNMDTLSFDQAQKSQENLKEKGIVLARERSFEKAIEALKEYTQKKSTDFAAYNALGISYKNLGEFSQAMNSFDKALILARNPEERSKILSNIGNLYSTTGKYQAALGFYKEAAAEFDKNPLYLILIARTFVMLGDYERARKVLQSLQEKVPGTNQDGKSQEDTGLDHYLLAEVFIGLNEEKNVYENIEKALMADPVRYVPRLRIDMQDEKSLFFTLQGDKRIQKMLNRFGR